MLASESHMPLQKPPLRPLGPRPQTRSDSSTATRASGSSCFKYQAVQRPVKPPPTITTSASWSPASGGAGVTSPASSIQ